MITNDLRSKSLDLLRFPLALVVLTIHVFTTDGLTIHGQTVTFENMPLMLEVNYFIDGFLRGQSVPVYFFISGFVFFLGVELTKEKYLQKLKNRVRTLFIPYVLWNLLAFVLLLIYFLPVFSSLFPGLHNSTLNLTLSSFGDLFWNNKGDMIVHSVMSETTLDGTGIYPIDVPLWFVRDLMIVVLCTPLLYAIIRKTGFYFICLLGLLWFFLSYMELGHVNQLLVAFFFFSWGAYMSINKKDMIAEFKRFFIPSMILYPVLSLLYVFAVHYCADACVTIKRLNVLVGLFFAYNISAWLLTRGTCKVSSFLAGASFFIYVSHCLICGNVLKGLFVILSPRTQVGMLVIYILTIVLTVAFLLGVFYMLRRYFPAFLKIIAGRR